MKAKQTGTGYRTAKRPAPALARRRYRTPRPRATLVAITCAAILFGAGAAHADAVTDWNTTANQATALPLPIKLRAMAMVQIAVHDALNSIDARYEGYSTAPGDTPGAIPEAAVAAAARDVLLVVTQDITDPATRAAIQAAVQDAYDDAIGALPGCPLSPDCMVGTLAGQQAATAILADRATDGWPGNPHAPYLLLPAPGVYQVTPNQQPPFPAFANWANIRPFTIGNSATFHGMFRAPPSPLLDLDNATYTVDYAKVKAFGRKSTRAASPNSSKSRIARFWYGSAGHDWAGLAQVATGNRNLDLWEHARLYALLAIAQADVTISVFESKYHYNFWRPVTAIRWINDGNRATTPDTDWTPYLVTPPYPDYPCGTPMLAGAGTETLRNVLGTDNVKWTATSNFPGQPGVPSGPVTRRFKSLSRAADEAAMSRVYAGIHFGTGCTVGVDQGEKIARYGFDHLLRPL